MWHLDSFGTQFTNGTLTIAVNGLSLEKNWCDPYWLPHWALENVNGLLIASNATRAGPSNFSIKDCFPPKTNLLEVNQQSLLHASQMVHQVNSGNDPLGSEFIHFIKKAHVTLNPNSGRPLHLFNLKTRGSKPRWGGHGAMSFNRSGYTPCIDERNPLELCDVVISPSKELVEAEECGMINRKRGYSNAKIVAVGIL